MSDIDSADVARLQSLIAAAGLPVDAPQIEPEDWLSAMGMDKKVQQKRLRFVLLKALGDSYVTSSFDESRLHGILGVGG